MATLCRLADASRAAATACPAAGLRTVAVAFPTDSEEVKDLLKGKTTELQDKATEVVEWAQVRRVGLCSADCH